MSMTPSAEISEVHSGPLGTVLLAGSRLHFAREGDPGATLPSIIVRSPVDRLGPVQPMSSAMRVGGREPFRVHAARGTRARISPVSGAVQ